MSTADQGASSPTAHLFNPLFAQPEGSPIRELFPYLSRPGMLSLAGGYPSPSLFDAEGLQQAAMAALQQDAATSLQYGASEGQLALREALAALCATRGIACTPADMIDRKSTRLNSSHTVISYAVFCLKKQERHR